MIVQSTDEEETGDGSRSPLTFCVLVFALSVPFWLLGAVAERQLLPGLPVSALALVCPVTAAAVLVHRQSGTAGVTRLLKRTFDYDRISAKAWYVPTVLLMPGVMVSSYGLMRVLKTAARRSTARSATSTGFTATRR